MEKRPHAQNIRVLQTGAEMKAGSARRIAELSVQLVDCAENLLMRGFYRLKQGEVLQRLTAAKGFGQRDAGGVEPVKAEILRNTLERMNGAERRSPTEAFSAAHSSSKDGFAGYFITKRVTSASLQRRRTVSA